MIAVDADLFQAFIDGAKAASHLRAVGVRKLVRQGNQVLLLGQHIVGHAAVALPSVRAAVLRAGAGDHVAASAIVAHAAAGNVVHRNAVAYLEAPAARAGLHNLAAWLVARHHTLVAFGAFAQMLVIDGANVGTADGGGLDAQQNLAMARRGHGHGAHFYG